MGEIKISGTGATAFVDRMMTNLVPRSKGEVTYTPLCYPDGGIVDDVLVYCMGDDDLMLVVNAANVEKDFRWLSESAPSGVAVENVSETVAQIAIQGPDAVSLAAKAMGQDISGLRRFSHMEIVFKGERIVASRTGYTGEDGCELYMANGLGPVVWEHLMGTEGPWSPEPVGLGARDTLRFEASYRLYGNDIDETTNPLEAGLGWTVKLAKEDFVGREALERLKEEGLKRRFVGLELGTKRIGRKDSAIYAGGSPVGVVTSGAYAPFLEKSLAMGYIPADLAREGVEMEVDLKGTRVPAVFAKIPFLSGRDRPKKTG
jgi:aminomethyltransferase